MIKFSKEKVLLLHQIMAEATGGDLSVRDDVYQLGMAVADGSADNDDVLNWIYQHKK